MLSPQTSAADRDVLTSWELEKCKLNERLLSKIQQILDIAEENLESSKISEYKNSHLGTLSAVSDGNEVEKKYIPAIISEVQALKKPNGKCLELIKTENNPTNNDRRIISLFSAGVQFYHYFMKVYANKSIRDSQLSNIHLICAEQIQKSIAKCFVCKSDKSFLACTRLTTNLKKKLDSEFTTYRILNEIAAEKDHCRNMYIDEMTIHLYSKKRQFFNKSRKVSDTCIKLFQVQLRRNGWENFSIEQVKLLKQEIGRNWQELKLANLKLLKSKTRTDGEVIKTQIKPTELPVIAIEFAYSIVKTGYIKNGNFETIHTKIIPTLRILQEENGKITTVPDDFECPNSVLVPIGKLLQQNPKNAKKKYGRRSEFFITLFLSQLKIDVEKKLGGSWTRTVITVPLSSTSIQRKVMKDSAFLAGFQSVTLLNDTTAAALSFATSGYHSPRTNNIVLIGIVGENYYDAALYNCHEGKTEMISCWGNLHAYKKPTSCNHGTLGHPMLFSNNALEHFFKDMIGYKNVAENFNNFCVEYVENSQIPTTFNKFGESWKDICDSSVLRGAAIFSEDSSPTICTDNFPYMFRRENPKQSGIFAHANKTPMVKKDTVGMVSTDNSTIKISEFSLMNSEYRNTAYRVKINEEDLKTSGELKIEYSLSIEGTFEVKKATVTRNKYTEVVGFHVISENLSEKGFRKLKDSLSSHLKDDGDEKNVFDKAEN